MSFNRIVRILANTVNRAVSQGAKGLAAGAVGGAVLNATGDIDEDIINCLVMGVLIGGINGAVDGFLEQLAIETGPEIHTGMVVIGQEVVVPTPEPHVARLHQLTELASFGTPALVWFIQTQAKDTNLSIGLTFGTYYAGIGIMAGGFAALLTVSCCCCLPSAAMLALFMKAFVSSNYADKLVSIVEGMHGRMLGGGDNDDMPVRNSNSRAGLPLSSIVINGAPGFHTSSNVITMSRGPMMFSGSARGGDIDSIFGRQQLSMQNMMTAPMGGGSSFGPSFGRGGFGGFTP